MRLTGTSAIQSIKLDDTFAVPKEIQILRVGRFNHPQYGAFEITPKVLTEMQANFDLKTRGVDLAVDYFHDADKEAAGWINSLELKEGGTELWANVSWTPTALKKLAERELRYFSPDFSFKWVDPETGTAFDNVLFGGGLTNRPFVKEMQAIVANENTNKGVQVTELEKAQARIKELEANNVKLSEDNKEMEAKLAAPPAPAPVPAPASGDAEAMKKEIADLKAQLAKAQGDMKVMADEKALADAAKCLAEKETAFNVLLSEGKACVAQKDSFLKGDMTEFLKLAQPVNVRASGSSESTTVVDTDSAAIIKLAEEKEKANPKLTRGESISLAKKELKK